MHGTYEHRITCNLHPHQYYPLVRAARLQNMPVAQFVRDAALAYIQRRVVLPPQLDERLANIRQEIRRVGTNLNQIAARTNTLQRITHSDLRHAGKLATQLERQVTVLRHLLESLPNARQIDGS